MNVRCAARWRICPLLAGLVVMPMALLAAAAAATPPASPDPEAADATAIAPQTPTTMTPAAGFKAYVDANGKLLEAPTEGSAILLEDFHLAPPNYDLMWTEILPDGSQLLHTEGQVQMATLARIGADGRIEQICLPAAAAATAVAESSR